MTRIQSFFRLSLQRKILAASVLGLSFYVYILFSFFNKFARFGKRIPVQDYDQAPDSRVNDIAWAIAVAARYSPWKNLCRHQAYQAKVLCGYYKIPFHIFIGLKKDDEKHEIQAHAWTMAGGQIITGFCNPKEYIVQSIYTNQ